MESTQSSRLPLLILSGLLIALLAYLNLPEPNVKQSQSARVVSVKTTPVIMAEFSDEFEALGTTKANEEVVITAQYTDIIKSIHFNDGDRVKKGDILVELFKAEEQAKIKELQANLDQSSAQLQRYKDLLEQSAASISQRDEQKAKVQSFRAQLLSAQATLNNLTIRAPFDGQLGFREVSVGALINDGSTITTLDDISVIKLDFAIPERFITTVNIGQTVASSNVAYPGKNFIGKVTSIAPRVDAVTRTIQIRAEIDNSNNKLRPGMLMSIILERNVAQVLQIPESAVIPYEDKHFVFVIENDTAKRVDISVGRRKPGIVEVTSGINEGINVVIEGALKLRDGSQVKTTSTNMETK
ncbi:efflux RND transporter periplasmic adaptor subunit [Thalassotalea psychrophila]|uniref:Efflux RND transporter periplasmic adaptor subunit n=1 Tax=Thalassotalea psychrophila TaxID=3065647 RepID=A0ABY9TUC9_9GAMM|nr:efflux RND transporter periplasmic adaptor subunit [Colwelliaceae bacterium SQ149]